MKINPDQSGFELLPFLRSPGGCLVTVFCDNRKRSSLAEYSDPQFKELTRLLNNNPDNPELRAW